MFERETRREKILESRNRELKLKEKAGAQKDEDGREAENKEDLQEADPIEKAEKDFFKIVAEEKARRQKKMVREHEQHIRIDWCASFEFFFC